MGSLSYVNYHLYISQWCRVFKENIPPRKHLRPRSESALLPQRGMDCDNKERKPCMRA